MATFTMSIAGSGIMADTSISWSINDADTQSMLAMAITKLSLPQNAPNEQVFTAAALARVQQMIQDVAAYQAANVKPITLTKL